MIRLVKIGDQINEGSDEFAFFDTITDQFLSFEGIQVFETKEMFEQYAKSDDRYNRCVGLIQ